MIVCIQLGLPLPILIAEIVVILKTHSFMNLVNFIDMEINSIFLPIVAVNILLDLICIVMLVVWFCMLIRDNCLKAKKTLCAPKLVTY